MSQPVALGDRLAFLGEVILEGGRRVHAMRRQMPESAISSKEQVNDLVTSADLACDQWIQAQLAKKFPHDFVLTEESGLLLPGQSKGSRTYSWKEIASLESVWIADPIDGTMNYVHRLEHYAICLAWMSYGQVLAAGLYMPPLDELLLASKGAGSTCNGKRIFTSSTRSLDHALLGTGFGYLDKQERQAHLQEAAQITDHVRGIRHLGSAACSLAKVAQGQFDGFWVKKVKPWDIASGILLVEEAGGVVQALGLSGDRYETGSILACNGHLLPLMRHSFSYV